MTVAENDATRLDWVTDRVLRGLIGGLLRLPYDMRVPVMGRALRNVIGPLAGYRRRIAENLDLIYPDMGRPARDRLIADCCDNFGRTLIENYSWQDLARKLAGTQPAGAGLAALQQAAADKRPVLFVTAHFGNHEAPRQVLTAMGYDIGGLYRPMKNTYFNDHYAKTMTDWGGPVFAQGRQGTAGFMRHLRDGGMGTLLFDVSAPGLSLPFLGQPARTATSAADIALKRDALVIPYFGIRQADGLTFAIDVQAPIAHSTPRQMLLDMHARLEAQITRHPAQWFWIHRRWKNGAA